MARKKPIQLELFSQGPPPRKKSSGVRLFSPEEDRLIAADYLQCQSLAVLVGKWGGTRATLSLAVRRGGGTVLSSVEARRKLLHRFAPDVELQIRRDYEECRNIAAVARKYKAPHATIRHLIWRVGGRTARNRHTLDVHAFDGAEGNPAAAYWIGFLLTDGCVTEKAVGQKMLAVGLHPKDIEHLRLLRAFLGSTHAISVTGNSVRFSVKSDHLAAVLAGYGIVPRKSLIAKTPESLKMNRHFWRGAVDGDGCLSFAKGAGGKMVRPSVGLVGTRDICESFCRFAATVTPDSRARVYQEGNIWRIAFTSRHAYKLAAHLYQDGDVALTRKRELALKMTSLGRESGVLPRSSD